MADGQESAFDASAVAEPEIEPDESSEQESGKEPEESAAAEGDRGVAGCPITMGYNYDLRCGRKLHVAQDGVDKAPACLMHSRDSRKQSGPLYDAFCLEFERILEDAGENEAHFEHFVFPQLDFSKRKFKSICHFNFATFTQYADFWEATFTQNANFVNATFTRDANFVNATFTRDAVFSLATFTHDADFSEATFTLNADFSGTTFTGNARFCSAIFSQGADFRSATFMRDADFRLTVFRKDANFWKATFTQIADFWIATFGRDANFSEATFMQTARFSGAKFHGVAEWGSCSFFDRAEYRHTKFESLDDGEPSAVFALAKFSKPGEIVFDGVDLSRAIFLNSDVSQVWFTSSVRWGTREDNSGLAVFDETIPLEQGSGERFRRDDGQRDYRAVEQIYQQLKKNYDARLDYWTGNEFHFGEMEMKRLAGPTDGPLLWLRQWFHRKLSLVALYRHASDYGNSYGKPMLWLLGILVLFAALLPLPGVGLKRQGDSRQPETYASVWRSGDGWTPNLWAEARLAGKGAITSVDAATFQKSAEYAPAYPWGRVLAIFETLLTSTLFALFLLAIRRQFRR